MGDRDDELLDEIPEHGAGGELHGYLAGRPARRGVIAFVVLAVLGATIAGVWWAKRRDSMLRAGDGGTYELAEGAETEDRPRELTWSSGKARLGLSRKEPGVSSIRLPDRVVRLADGYDHAQIKVDVQDGKTRRLDVLVGDVVVELDPEVADQ